MSDLGKTPLRNWRLGAWAVALAFSVPALSSHGSVAVARPREIVPDDQLRAFLDRNYPFIDPGAELPGKEVPSDDPLHKGRVWKGAMGWRTRQGKAVVRWSTGRPWDVVDALYPDRSRGPVNFTLDHGFRRPSSGPRRWIYGAIDIRPDDVVFTDAAAQPTYDPPASGDDANLERDLSNDAEFLRALRDDYFARVVYYVFQGHEFVRSADLKTWMSGDRGAARLVAGLRGLGESYQDYYLDYDFDEVWPDDRANREQELRRLIELSEKMSAAMRAAEEARWSGSEERLQKLKSQLVNLDKDASSPTMLALRGLLARLGWRTANEDDDRRMARDAMASGLDLVRELDALATRPESGPAPWAEPIRQRLEVRGGFGFERVIAARDLEALTPDQRAVRLGLGRRIDQLAASGRISEPEYEQLRSRNLAVERRIGHYSQP